MFQNRYILLKVLLDFYKKFEKKSYFTENSSSLHVEVVVIPVVNF